MQDQRRWQQLKAGELKPEIESLICAAHEQASPPPCRLCKEKVESVTHVVSSCSLLAGNQYRKRHDKLGKKVSWLLCKKSEIEYEDK